MYFAYHLYAFVQMFVLWMLKLKTSSAQHVVKWDTLAVGQRHVSVYKSSTRSCYHNDRPG